MLTILIDSGNSRIKVTYLLPGNSQPQQMLVIDHQEISKLKDWLSELPEMPTQAFGVNVAGQVIAAHIQAVLPTDCMMHWLSAEKKTLHLKCLYNSLELGADRWYALLGLKLHHPINAGSALLVTMGTATTIDCLDGQHQFLGGQILPGVLMMTESLNHGTANLPVVGLTRNYLPPKFPRTTDEAIATGVITAQIGAIMRQWQELYFYTNELPTLYLSGGARHAIVPELKRLMKLQLHDWGFSDLPLKEIRFPVLDGLRVYAIEQGNA